MRARASHIPMTVLGQLPLPVEEVLALRGVLERLNTGLMAAAAEDDTPHAKAG
jgi:hypothetical protein